MGGGQLHARSVLSNFNSRSRNYLGVLLKSPDFTTKCRFSFNRSEAEPESLHFYPDEDDANGPGTTRPEAWPVSPGSSVDPLWAVWSSPSPQV